MTLYKNEKSALPLSDTKHKKVALIGPQGTNAGALLWTALHRALLSLSSLASPAGVGAGAATVAAIVNSCCAGLLFGNYAGSANGGNWGMSIAQGLIDRLAKSGGNGESLYHSTNRSFA